MQSHGRVPSVKTRCPIPPCYCGISQMMEAEVHCCCCWQVDCTTSQNKTTQNDKGTRRTKYFSSTTPESFHWIARRPPSCICFGVFRGTGQLTSCRQSAFLQQPRATLALPGISTTARWLLACSPPSRRFPTTLRVKSGAGLKSSL